MNKKTAGFNSADGKPEKREKVNTLIKGFVPGDVLMTVEGVMKDLNLSFTEIATLILSSFGVQEIPFVRHRVKLPNGEEIEIPVGQYDVKGVGQIRLEPGQSYHSLFVAVHCTLDTDSPNAKEMFTIFVETLREKMKTVKSVFKGHALRLTTPDDLIVPENLNLSKKVNLFFNPDVSTLLDVGLFTPITQAQKCREVGIKLKRGILLEGSYGTGKSSIAYVTAQIAVENGWTFLLINPGLVALAFEIAKLLEPCVIFTEDIDSRTSEGRNRLNGLLNTISGVTSKQDREVIIVCSTNFADRIDAAMMRPDRIDMIIPFSLPEGEAVMNIVRATCGAALVDEFHSPSVGWDLVLKAAINATPAIIVEACERAKIDMIAHGVECFTLARVAAHLSMMERQKELAIPVWKDEELGDRLVRDLQEAVGGGGL